MINLAMWLFTEPSPSPISHNYNFYGISRNFTRSNVKIKHVCRDIISLRATFCNFVTIGHGTRKNHRWGNWERAATSLYQNEPLIDTLWWLFLVQTCSTGTLNWKFQLNELETLLFVSSAIFLRKAYSAKLSSIFDLPSQKFIQFSTKFEISRTLTEIRIKQFFCGMQYEEIASYPSPFFATSLES